MRTDLRRLALLIVLLLGPYVFVSFVSAADKEISVAGKEQCKETERLNKEALNLFNSGKLREAITIWKRAAELAEKSEPGCAAHVEALSNLGLAYYKTGSQYYPLAETYLDRVVEIDPNAWIAYLILGDLCYENYKPDCAIGNYDLLLKLNPTYKHARRVAQRLDVLTGMRNDSSENEDKASRSRRKHVNRIVVVDDLPEFYFYLTINDESFLSRIDIVRENEPFIHQTLKYGDGDIECTPPNGDVDLIEANDFNGDGYNDAKVLCTSDDQGRNGYLYYLYDIRKSIFLPFTGGALPDQADGQDAKEIRTYDKFGDGGRSSVERIYNFSAGNLVLIKEERRDGTSR